MNRYMKDRLMGMDSRRGVPGSGRRDRNYGYDEYDNNEYTHGNRDREYEGREMSERGKVPQRDRGYDRPGRDSRRRDMMYDDYENYRDFEYMDYHKGDLELSEKDIRKWEKTVKNSDGTTGAKFYKDQIIPLAKQMGITFDKFTEDEFMMAVNMMYSDYCRALQDSSVPNYMRPEPYVHMAKAFLCDKDFNGKPYEKLAIYYYEIVDYDE